MKILVTGAAGFIGSHAAERLHAMGHQVVAIDNFSPYYNLHLKNLNARALAEKNIVVLDLDINSYDLKERLPDDLDYIFHFAAHPGISHTSTFDEYLRNNVQGTQRLIELAEGLENKPYFVYMSTSSVYGLEATFSEIEITKPASWYGVTKLAGEQLVLAKIREKKMKGTSFRLFSVYGPRERPDKLYTRLIDCALNNKEFSLFEGSEKHLRSFTYVEDILDGITSVFGKEQECNGEIFNLGTEIEHSTAEGIATVEKLMNAHIKTVTTSPRPGDQFKTKAIIDKARDVLGYDPQTTLKEGLQVQIEWFKANIKFL